MSTPEFNVRFFPEMRAGGFSRIDSTVQFYGRINALLKRDFVVLDFGAGRGVSHLDDPIAYRRDLVKLKGKVREVIGADIDPIVTSNPSLDRALILKANHPIPLDDESIDLIVSDFTFEHIEQPLYWVSELSRILKPGGWICARTPNRYGYVAVANRIIPESLRMRIVRLAQPDRKEEDVFKTFYRLNSSTSIKKHFLESNFEHSSYSWNAEPAYCASSRVLYRSFLILHAITPSPLRTLLLLFLRKKNHLSPSGT